MIDPTSITNYNLDKYQLQEMVLFWSLVAGKNARTTARLLEDMLQMLNRKYGTGQVKPFEIIDKYDREFPGKLEDLMRDIGFGCQKAKARCIRELIAKDLDLNTCSVDQLESIHNIGPKTARCFIMHTRKNARHAGLDTHCLKWLSSLGYKVPKVSPKGKVYKELEDIFLGLADKLNMTPAVLDLAIWNAYSLGIEYKVNVLEAA